VVDILLIFTVGGGILIWMFVSHMKVKLEIISYAIITCNMGVGGMVSLYLPVPPVVHRAYLVVLNAIMAIMLVETLPMWILFFFVTILAILGITIAIHHDSFHCSTSCYSYHNLY
jgi:hypothetical protein